MIKLNETSVTMQILELIGTSKLLDEQIVFQDEEGQPKKSMTVREAMQLLNMRIVVESENAEYIVR